MNAYRSEGAPITGKTTPGSYHHGSLPEALLAAADDVLAERGLSGFTLRECARRAGVSHAAPKHHFGDVKGLLTAIAARGFVRLTSAIQESIAAAGDDLETQFCACARAYTGYALREPEHFRVMFRVDLLNVNDGNGLEAAHATFTELTNVILRQRGEPEIQIHELDQTVDRSAVVDDIILGWTLIHGYAHLRLERQLSMVPDSDHDRVLERAAIRISNVLRQR